jgi:hypothetical protein
LAPVLSNGFLNSPGDTALRWWASWLAMIDLFLAPLQGAQILTGETGGLRRLRPPATVCQPSGLVIEHPGAIHHVMSRAEDKDCRAFDQGDDYDVAMDCQETASGKLDVSIQPAEAGKDGQKE